MKKPKNSDLIIQLIATLGTAFACAFIIYAIMLSAAKEAPRTEDIPYSQFLDMLQEDDPGVVEITGEKISLKREEEGAEVIYKSTRVKDDGLVDRLRDAGVEFSQKPDGIGMTVFSVILNLLPICFLFYLSSNMLGKNGLMSTLSGDTDNTTPQEKKSQIRFSDVAGEDEAKESLMEIVDILHNPAKYTELGAKLPKGVLLVGPPGTGKTLLAKAVAGEAGVPFLSMSGSEFVEMFVGLGAKRVRNLFKEAEKSAPCIVFIDEIDAVGQARSTRGTADREHEQTLNQLLSEMDGFDSTKGIMVLGATNRPEILDKALLRPGRFDRQIIVESPDLEGRVEILKIHTAKMKLADDVDLRAIASMAAGAAGADLANIANESAIAAARKDQKFITQADLLESIETVLAGREKKTRILHDLEKKIVAHHEVGHALITAVLTQAEPVQKITIIPRTNGALGYVLQVPEEEKFLHQKEELKSRLVTLLGGRAAEEVFFQEVSTGASNDLERATRLARDMVAKYGMSELGNMNFTSEQGKYLGQNGGLYCGNDMESKIDQETVKLLTEAYETAKSIVTEHQEKAAQIAAYLYEHETITGEEFLEIFHAAA